MTRKPKAGGEASPAASGKGRTARAGDSSAGPITNEKGGAKSATIRSGSRRVRVTAAPPAALFSLGLHPTLFTAADVPKLVCAAGLPLKAGADPSSLAIMLDQAFTMALTFHVPNARRSPRRLLLDFLLTVEMQAQALMATLWVPFDRVTGQPDNTADWYVHLDHGLSGPAPPGSWVLTWDGDHRDLYMRLAKKAAEALPDASGQDRTRAMQEAGSRAVLSVVPTALRTLAAAARAAHDLQPVTPERVGRRENVFNASLFPSLHWVHQEMFGRSPVIRDETGRGGRGICWARAAIRLAARRIKRATSEAGPGGGPTVMFAPEAVGAILNVDRLSNDRIADLLGAARAALNRGKGNARAASP